MSIKYRESVERKCFNLEMSVPLEVRSVRAKQNESTLFWSCISLPLIIGDMDYTLQPLCLFILLCLFTHSGVKFYRLQ